jgi:hypothetical protein
MKQTCIAFAMIMPLSLHANLRDYGMQRAVVHIATQTQIKLNKR